MTVLPASKDPPWSITEMDGEAEDPEKNPPKTYAKAVDDLKKVTMDEVQKFEEEYIRDEKKWESTLNIPRNDLEVRKCYLQDITKMRKQR